MIHPVGYMRILLYNNIDWNGIERDKNQQVEKLVWDRETNNEQIANTLPIQNDLESW